MEKNAFRIRAFERKADRSEDPNTIHVLVQDMSRKVSIETEVREGNDSIFDLFDERKATPEQHKLMGIAKRCMDSHAKNEFPSIYKDEESVIVWQGNPENIFEKLFKKAPTRAIRVGRDRT